MWTLTKKTIYVSSLPLKWLQKSMNFIYTRTKVVQVFFFLSSSRLNSVEFTKKKREKKEKQSCLIVSSAIAFNVILSTYMEHREQQPTAVSVFISTWHLLFTGNKKKTTEWQLCNSQKKKSKNKNLPTIINLRIRNTDETFAREQHFPNSN